MPRKTRHKNNSKKKHIIVFSKNDLGKFLFTVALTATYTATLFGYTLNHS